MHIMFLNYPKIFPIRHWLWLFLWLIVGISCQKPDTETHQPTPYELAIPPLFAEKLIAPVIPVDNPLTVEGVALGERLFFEKLLSRDRTQSCASCHQPQRAFVDNTRFSDGIDGTFGTRNAMPLFNLAWNYDARFAWDGKELGLEQQALEPITNPIEMHGQWPEIIRRLNAHPQYPSLFEQAFGTPQIDSLAIVKALAQFERTLISGQSKFDRYLQGDVLLTEAEQNGLAIFMDETKGDCFHCHGSPNNPLWTDNQFHNNGLDAIFTDLGLGAVTGQATDKGKFRTPSLRNLSYTAPYMHDGRFETLEEVVAHYSSGLQPSSTIDPLMKKVQQGGVQLTQQEQADLIAFLRSLDDPQFIANSRFPNNN